MKLKYYVVLALCEYNYIKNIDFVEFSTLKKARRYLNKCYKDNVAENPEQKWLTQSHNSFGNGEWIIRLERGFNPRDAVIIK